MKKLIALVIALMLFTVPALAEDTDFIAALEWMHDDVPALAEDTLTYTHPTHGYSLEYPAAWLAVDATNIDQYIELFNNNEISFTGTNAPTLTNMKDQIVGQDIVVLVDPHANNLLVVCADMGMELTNEMFQMVMVPMVVESVKAQAPGIEITADGTIQEMGDRSFIAVGGNVNISGIPAEIMQMYYLEGTMMYCFTVTLTGAFGAEAAEQFAMEAAEVMFSFTTGK
ncbi:MAG: hypothetical protein IJD39_06465 [Clostridia bacterium]|nr:hypothetical protein [Clostridia bacterium]